MGSLVTLGNSFNYDSQFGLTPGNIRNLGFIWILRRVTFKGAGSDRFRGEGTGERFRERGKYSESIRMGN